MSDLRAALKASVDHPDEVSLYGRLRDAAAVLNTHAEAIRMGALRNETPSLETMLGVITAIHLADQAALAYAATRGIYIKTAETLT